MDSKGSEACAKTEGDSVSCEHVTSSPLVSFLAAVSLLFLALVSKSSSDHHGAHHTGIIPECTLLANWLIPNRSLHVAPRAARKSSMTPTHSAQASDSRTLKPSEVVGAHSMSCLYGKGKFTAS